MHLALFSLRMRFLVWPLALLLFPCLPGTSAAQQPAATPAAADPGTRNLGSSLDFVPANTAFYMATTNHQQIWQNFVQSRAYAALKDSPAGRKMRKAYRKGLARGWEQFGENPFRYYLEGYANSLDSVQGKLVMPYIERLFNQELFVYVDDQVVPFVQTIGVYYDELTAVLIDSDEQEDPDEIWKTFESIGNKHLRGLKVPTIVVGAITDEPEVFVGFLELLNTGFQQMIRENPIEMQLFQKAVRFQSEGTGAADRFAYFGFEVAGDELPFDQLKAIDPDLSPVLGALQPMYAGKTFAFAFAVRGQAVLMTFGPSLEHLRQLGVGPRLLDQPHLAPLREARAAGQSVCLVGYRSTEFARLWTPNWSGWVNGTAFWLTQAIAGMESELLSDEEKRDLLKRLDAEAEQCLKDLETLAPRPGASLTYGLLTAEGIEGFAYEFDRPAVPLSDQPLSLPSKLSAPPLLVAFQRNEANPQLWRVLGSYLDKLFAGMEEFGPLLAEDLEQAEISAIVLERLAPLLQNLSQTTFGELLPELAGREWGVIVDFSLAKESWHQAMPTAREPLPAPGTVLLLQHGNAAAMEQIGERYLAAARKLLADIKDLGTYDIPSSLEIPDPEQRTLPFGLEYGFPLPTSLGFSPEWKPHAVIGEKLLAIGYFPEQTARVLQPPQAQDQPQSANAESTRGVRLFGPAGETTRPASGVLYLDNHQLADALEAWLNYGLEQAKAGGESLDMNIPADSADLNLSEEELRQTLAATLNLYRTFHGFSSRSYQQGNTRVEHFLLKFADR